jgi:hypothetical protein
MRPQRGDYPPYFENYIPLVKQNTVLDAIAETKQQALDFIRTIDPALENMAYAEGKWTIKEVIIHCMDTERVFSTRAMGFARGETQPALPYDENIYAAHSHAKERSLTNIAEEFECVMNATLALFKSFSNETLAAKGKFPAGITTVNAMGFAVCGHTLHHLNMIRERYLKK